MNSLNCHWSQPIIQEWFTGACTLYSALLHVWTSTAKMNSPPRVWVFWHSPYSDLFSLFPSLLPPHHLFYSLPPEKQEIRSFPANWVFLCWTLCDSAPVQASRISLSINDISTGGQRILSFSIISVFVSSQWNLFLCWSGQQKSVADQYFWKGTD